MVSGEDPRSDRHILAADLAAAQNARKRLQLLSHAPHPIDISLALAIKDICYEHWTSEPTIAQGAAAALALIARKFPDPKISAVADWVKGISDITRGRLEPAVTALERSSAQFRAIGDLHSAAQPQVAKLIALAMLGRYDEAAAAGSDALRIFRSEGDELAAAKIEMNLSNVAARRERHREAEVLSLSALKRFKKLGEAEWQAMAENDVANTYAELGELRLADRYYRSALERAKSSGMEVTVAEIEASIGDLARTRGQYADALERLERSRSIYERMSMPHQSAIAELEIADIYAELNLYEEAIGHYERLTKQLRALKLRSEEARARANFGRVLLAANELKRSRAQLNRSIRLYEAEDNPAGQAMALMLLSTLEGSAGNAREAERRIAEALKLLSRTHSPRRENQARWLQAELFRRAGRNVEDRLAAVLNGSRKLHDAVTEIASLTSLGKLFVRMKMTQDAGEYFRAAVKRVESLRAPLPGEEFRRAFIEDKLEPYHQLAALYLSTGKRHAAFRWIERARARSLDELISESTPRTDRNATDPAVAELREKLNWIYSRGSDGGQENSQKLEKELSALMRRKASVSKNSAAAAKNSELDMKALRAALRTAGRTFVEFTVIDGMIDAFVIGEKRLDHYPGIAASDAIGQLVRDLHFQFSAFRLASSNTAFTASLSKKTDAILHSLYLKLAAPWIDETAGRDLIISPSGLLNLVPFGALHNGRDHLISTRDITYSPSAAVWQKLSRRRRRKPEPAVLFGFGDERIPFVEGEIAALQGLLPDSKTFLGRAATFENFLEAAPTAGLLHVACHGTFRPDNPMYSSLHFANGSATVVDLLQLRLNAELVTLSACETGISKIYPGDETVGLARGFLAAGASNIILSLWTVNDFAARELMAEVYKSLQRGDKISASLRNAQVKFIERGLHPYLWAPFILIGE